MTALFLKQIEALADKQRLSIIKEISKKGTLTCVEAEKCTRLSQPTTSHHIKVLLDAKLITGTKKGRFLSISLHKKNIAKLEHYFHLLTH